MRGKSRNAGEPRGRRTLNQIPIFEMAAGRLLGSGGVSGMKCHDELQGLGWPIFSGAHRITTGDWTSVYYK